MSPRSPGSPAGSPTDRTRPILLVAYAPPRGDGPGALDWALGGANDGDPDLARLLPSLKVRVGAFAHVDEAGGREEDGKAAIAGSGLGRAAYVNVGAARCGAARAVAERASGAGRR